MTPRCVCKCSGDTKELEKDNPALFREEEVVSEHLEDRGFRSASYRGNACVAPAYVFEGK